MIKVLLVDDENLALEYLQNIISWEDYGFQLIGMTTDAQQALTLYKRYKPDIVISDVKMPGMNGLELVNAIREYGGRSHILFLSAYKNFDYVKQAIRLDIDDYLLKSDIEEETFLKKILKLKEVINKEKAQNQYTVSAIMEELFKKNVPEEKFKEILEENDYIRLHKKYYYTILAEKVAPKFLNKFIPQKENSLRAYEYEYKNACLKFNGEENVSIISLFPINETEYLAILEINANIVSQKEINERLYCFAKTVFNEINNESQRFDLYYYAQRTSIRQFGCLYQQNKSILSQRYLNKKAQIIRFGKEECLNKIMSEPKSITTREIYNMIRQENYDGIEKCIQIIKIAMAEEDYFCYLWYIKNMFEALSLFGGTLAGKQSGRKFSLIENSSSYDFRNPEELLAFLEFKIDEIKFIGYESHKLIYSTVISNAIDYIKAQYSNPELTSSMVANDVNISGSWLSTKFKEEVGIKVSDYINNIRIEQARLMFDQEDYMIYEVSEKVGFASSQYFSKIFKEIVGVTPNKYRKNNSRSGKSNET